MITRRNVIKGMAAGTSLLALGRTGFAQTATSPRRVVFFFTPQGASEYDSFDQFATSTSPIGLGAPLARHSDNIVIFKNMSIIYDKYSDAHISGQLLTLTNSPSLSWQGTASAKIASESLDNFLSRNLGQMVTPALPSLQLGVAAAQDDSGTVSYDQSGAPIIVQTDPLKVYNSIFKNVMGGKATQVAAKVPFNRRSLVLKQALSDWSRFQAQLTPNLLARVAPYNDAMNTLLAQASAAAGSGGGSTGTSPGAPATCTVPAAPNTSGTNWDDAHNALTQSADMRGLIVGAFTCDLTRIVTVTFQGIYNGPNGGLIAGVDSETHPISHTGDNPNYQSQFVKIKAAMFEEIAKLADSLKAIPEGNGTMLDNTLIVHVSEISGIQDSQTGHGTHNGTSIPFFTIGGKNMGVKVGSFLNLPTQASSTIGVGFPHGNFLRSIIKAMGLPEQAFGTAQYSTQLVPGFLA
ncbi:MAG: hypothetical protein C5B49_14695 [Bdellovibrio sp.]|nr:MAG: hypothetical protein C5B49_14695 [Bdellovibrio sp.]